MKILVQTLSLSHVEKSFSTADKQIGHFNKDLVETEKVGRGLS